MRRTSILILTALFLFSLSFLVTYYYGLWIYDVRSVEPLSEPGGIPPTPSGKTMVDGEHDSSLEKEEMAPPSIMEKREEIQTTPVVEVQEVPELSYEEIVEQRVRESMLQKSDFSWNASQRYIGIIDEYVGVFQGEPGIGGILVEETDISIHDLPEFEIRNLRRGIAFESEEEKYSILEGLHFPK